MAMIDQLAERLVGAGLRHAFGITGSGATLALIGALEDRGVRYTMVSHEGVAAVMAGAATVAGGAPALSISIKGPGYVNMLAGIAHNRKEGRQAISVAEAYDAATPLVRAHKRIDQHALGAPVVKCDVGLPEALADFDALLGTAGREVPGPVHIDLATRASGSLVSPGTRDDPAAASSEATVLAELERARRPAIIAGSWAGRRPWGPKLVDAGVPIFTTAAAKGVVDERARSAAGVFTGAGGDLAPERAVLAACDLVIGLGLRADEVLGTKLPADVLLLDAASDLTPPGSFGAATVTADDALVASVVAACRERAWGTDLVAAARARCDEALLAAPWSPARCFELLGALAIDHRLVLDTGAFCTIGEHLWPARPARPFLGSSCWRAMGTGLPTAVGAALAAPDMPVVCVVGDGGMRMHPIELAGAVADRLALCVILMRDGRFGSVAGAASCAVSRAAVEIRDPSWVPIVAAMGCPTVAAEDPGAFQEALAGWGGHRPLFVEARFDPVHYEAMTKGLR